MVSECYTNIVPSATTSTANIITANDSTSCALLDQQMRSWTVIRTLLLGYHPRKNQQCFHKSIFYYNSQAIPPCILHTCVCEYASMQSIHMHPCKPYTPTFMHPYTLLCIRSPYNHSMMDHTKYLPN